MTKGLLSDQVDTKEIEIIIRELNKVIDKKIAGDVVELGCYVGTTTVYLAKTLMTTSKRLYVYDSFEGLPEKTKQDLSPLGQQFQIGELHATKKQLIKNLTQARVPIPYIKKAWFSDLTKSDMPESIAFAFLDGDYYGSITDSLKVVEPHLIPGSVIVVDDYSNAALPGVARAVDEWLTGRFVVKKIEQSLAIISII
ncbi:MAG: TylF/MycF/NovP-related O-methyltransferase [Candidatus Saccharibacteria bacterium]